MGRMEKSIVIKAPPEKVWEMLTWERLPDWMEGYQKEHASVEYTSEVSTSEDKYRVGASAHITTKRGELDFEMTESIENEKITYRAKGSWDGIVTYILEPVEDGTKLTYVVEYEIEGGIYGKFIEKTIGKLGERGVEKAFEKLKNILEK